MGKVAEVVIMCFTTPWNQVVIQILVFLPFPQQFFFFNSSFGRVIFPCFALFGQSLAHHKVETLFFRKPEHRVLISGMMFSLLMPTSQGPPGAHHKKVGVGLQEQEHEKGYTPWGTTGHPRKGTWRGGYYRIGGGVG